MGYVQHIIGILDKAGADRRNSEHKRMLDDAVREVLEMQRADWQDVWAVVKPLMQSEDKEKWLEFETRVKKLLIKKLIMG